MAQPPTLLPAQRVSLSDVAQDIAGDLPRELLLRWNDSARTTAVHDELLAPYLVRGTIVSSDSAGLSSLTQRLPLAAVLKLVSEPKEILYALARAVGAEPIGVWTADNAQLFFDESIAPSTVLEQLIEAQRTIATRAVQIGIGVHVARCYRIAGGLYGEEADLIEHVAEDVTRGGEILITQSTYENISSAQRARSAPCEPGRGPVPLRSITQFDGPSLAVNGEDTDYPAPFSRAFLHTLRAHSVAELSVMPLHDHRRRSHVVFVKVSPGARLRLLDAFTELALVDGLFRRTVERHRALTPSRCELIKSNGALAIALFEQPSHAVEFALELEEELSANAPDARIALAHGEVFVFDLDAHSSREIAGDPVNIAAKLAEDTALDGVLVDRSISLPSLPASRASERYSLRVGSIALEGARIVRR